MKDFEFLKDEMFDESGFKKLLTEMNFDLKKAHKEKFDNNFEKHGTIHGLKP